jgi:3-hydroxyisobutyrate dehydrogenase-like beta-hydroxyacid dehydrogenase
MEIKIGLVGFGEAGFTFAIAGDWAASVHVFDCKTDSDIDAPAMRARYADAGVSACNHLADAVQQVPLVLSLVTADQALAVAEAVANCLEPGTYYCDMNSIAPQTKQAAAALIEASGGHYIDVALMAPINPARLSTPLLLSGSGAGPASDILGQLGFTNRRVVGASVGRASSIKMIRSVVVKGIEALSAECALAADAAGVLDEVLASLDESEKAKSWQDRFDYNLDRMMIHGLRRAAEMEEVVKCLDGLGTGSAVSRATVERQRAIGALAIERPHQGLTGKLHQLNDRKAMAAWR